MKNETVRIAGWQQGMTDMVEGDLAYEMGQPMNNCLWLENYNPNIIMQSLTMRVGIDYVRGTETTPMSGSPTDGIYTPYYPLDLSGKQLDTLHPIVLGASEILVNRPAAHRMKLIFLTQYENSDIDYQFPKTRLVVSTLRKDPNYDNQYMYIWHEPFSLPHTMNNNGVEMLGAMSDWCNFVNNIFIVTKKSKIELAQGLHYPVYVYSYDDAGKYSKYVLMPINYKQDAAESGWRTRKATELLLDTDKIRVIQMMYDDLLRLHTYYSTTSPVNQLHPDFSRDDVVYNNRDEYEGSDTIHPIIGKMADSSSMEVYTHKSGIETENTDNKLTDKVDLIFWQTDELPAYNKQKTIAPIKWSSERCTLNGESYDVGDQSFVDETAEAYRDDYYLTVEGLNLDKEKWLPYCKISGDPRSVYAHKQYDEYVESDILSYYAQIPEVKQKIHYNRLDKDIEVITYPGFNLHQSRVQAFQYDLETIYTLEASTIDDSTAYLPMDPYYANGLAYFFRHLRPHETLTTFMLPNYIKNQTPRYWIHGEKIPYVLTAVIDGVETEVKRGVYEVPPCYDWPDVQNDGGGVINTEIDLLGRTVGKSVRLGTIKGGNPNTILSYYNVWNQSSCHPDRMSTSDDEDISAVVARSNIVLNTKADLYNIVSLYNNDKEDGSEMTFDEDHRRSAKLVYTPVYHRMPFVGFTLRLNYNSVSEAIDDLPSGLSAFKLYFSVPDESAGVINRDVYGNTFAPSGDGYALPFVTDDKQNQYRLVKIFTLKDSEGDRVSGHKWGAFERGLQGTPGFSNSNRWTKIEVDDELRDMRSISNASSNGIYAIPEGNINGYLNFRNIPNETYQQWTPDFYLWDYPITGELLTDNLTATGDVQLWQGVGARLITVTRGAVVIAGCQDEFGDEEDGIIRVSLNQNGKQLMDVFKETDKLYVAKGQVTALVNFNEHIFTFTTASFTRVVLSDLTRPSTWQVANTVHGQGVANPKMVTLTPYGIVFANSNGIFLTDGSKVEEIGKPISNIYRTGMQNAVPHTQTYMFEVELSGDPEINYISKNDEVHICFKQTEQILGYKFWRNKEYALIFSFAHKNWRIESYDLNATHEGSTQILYNGGTVHKMIWDNTDEGKMALMLTKQDVEAPMGSMAYNLPLLKRIASGRVYSSKREYDTVPYFLSLESGSPSSTEVEGVMITNDIGNGLDDYLLDSFSIEGYPTNNDGTQNIYNINKKDPDIRLATRHASGGFILSQYEYIYNLMRNNLKQGWDKWLMRTSPTNMAPSEVSRRRNRTRESFLFRVPFGIKFRKSVLYFKSNSLVTIREIQLNLRQLTRKFYS